MSGAPSAGPHPRLSRGSWRQYVHNLDATTSCRRLPVLYGNDGVVFMVRMSFGYGVGDFLKALELANEIRTRFVDAPEQFEAISDE
jgi:hypothetical protein